MAEPELLTVRWGDQSYSAGQLTAADAIAMEEEFGSSFWRIDFSSVKAIAWLVWLVRRHEEPDLKLEDVTDAAFASLMAAAQEEEADPPPPASSERASGSARSGARRGRASSASTRGTSSD